MALLGSAPPRLIRLPTVRSITGGGTTSVYEDEKLGLLPPRIKRGRSSFWVESEVGHVIAARIAGASDDEVRALVTRLVTERALGRVDGCGAVSHEPAP